MMPRGIALSATAGAVIVLTGCFQNPIDAALDRASEKVVEQAIEGLAGSEGIELDYGPGAEIPAGWPASVPIPQGTVVSAAKLDESAFTIAVLSPSWAQAQADLESLKAAGFSVVFEQVVDDYATYQLESSEYYVIYGMMNDGSEVTVSVTLGPK
jgi:hypothetical protein